MFKSKIITFSFVKYFFEETILHNQVNFLINTQLVGKLGVFWIEIKKTWKNGLRYYEIITNILKFLLKFCFTENTYSVYFMLLIVLFIVYYIPLFHESSSQRKIS